MDQLGGTQLTDAMFANPWAFDPNQQTNRFSNYQNQAMPYPLTYGGTPTNAMGQPIQSYQDWLRQNPSGVSLNQTPAQPQQQAPGPFYYGQAGSPGGIQSSSTFDPRTMLMGAPGVSRAQSLQNQQTINNQIQGLGPGTGPSWGPGPTGGTQGAPQGGGPANNWNAAISALANPGNPVTQGAAVPLSTGYQPAGGVNAAWLQQAAGRPNVNQNFLSALRAIQGR